MDVSLGTLKRLSKISSLGTLQTIVLKFQDLMNDSNNIQAFLYY